MGCSMDLKKFLNETLHEVILYRRPQKFKYSTLTTATKGFSTFLGKSGSVCRGGLILQGNEIPTEVAVERLSKSTSGLEQFSAVVNSVGQMHHRNLVRLLGCCNEKGELLLVYDYMPNGSLHEHLHATQEEPVLSWSRRLKILCGVSRALAYLHEGWEQRVIHGNVNPAHIKLDGDYNAHLDNFDMALCFEHDQANSSTIVQGTAGYLDPAYLDMGKFLNEGIVTEGIDVYAFGITVLEVATGKAPPFFQENMSKTEMVDWMWNLYRDDALLQAADPTLGNAYDPGEMILILKTGLLCCHPKYCVRPDMTDVINIWKGSIPFPPLPCLKPDLGGGTTAESV